jgi:hypothetical protein
MCDEQILKLANLVNQGIQPTAVFFEGTHCSGEMYPKEGSQVQVNTNLTRNNDPNWPTFKRANSIFVPQNINVRLESIDGSGYINIVGPQTIHNINADPILSSINWLPNQDCPTVITPATACSPVQWCFNSGDTCCDECFNCKVDSTCTNCVTTCSDENTMKFGTIGTIRQNTKQSWSIYIEEMCSGATDFKMGPYEITEYLPQSNTCDSYMSEYCNDNSSPVCGCFADVQYNEIENLSLPVKCFGIHCKSTNAYLTKDMDQYQCTERNCNNWVYDNKQKLIEEYPTTDIQCGEYEINITNVEYMGEDLFSEILFLFLIISMVIGFIVSIILFFIYKY